MRARGLLPFPGPAASSDRQCAVRAFASGLVLVAIVGACGKQESPRFPPWVERNHAEITIPDAQLFKVYRKQFGLRPLKDGDIQIYFISWGKGDGRILIDRDSIEVTYASGRAPIWHIPNTDTSKHYKARAATEEDSFPPLQTVTRRWADAGSLYDTLVRMGADTMVSPSAEAWDQHESKLFIVESYRNGRFNIFQFSYVLVESDARYSWIDERIDSLVPEIRPENWIQRESIPLKF